MNQTLEIAMPGISCMGCVGGVKKLLLAHKNEYNIQSFFFDIANKSLYVSASKKHEICQEIKLNSLLTAIQSLGVDCHLVADEKKEQPPVKEHWLKHIMKMHRLWASLGLVFGIALLTASVAGLSLSLPAMIALHVSTSALTGLVGAGSFYQAWKKLWYSHTLTMDSLFSLSAIAIVTVSSLAFFIPGLPMMLEAGLLIFGFRHLGQAIEETLVHNVSGDKRFQDRVAQKSEKLVEGAQFQVRTQNLKPDDIIILSAGDVIPADGTLLSAHANIHDTIESGSSLPRRVKQGAPLKSGFTLGQNTLPVQVKLLRNPKHSYLAQLDAQLIQIQSEKAPVETFTDTLLQYFIPSVLALSTIVGLGLSAFFPIGLALKSAIAVLVSACPCTLGLIVPLGVKVGVKKALENGIVFKEPSSLETATKVDTIVLDLNGSLTKGTPDITSFTPTLKTFTPQVLHQLCHLLEKNAEHPVGRALATYSAKQSRIKNCHAQTKPTLVQGGIRCIIVIEGKHHSVTLGNQQAMDHIQAPLPSQRPDVVPGMQTLFLAIDGQVQAFYCVHDPLREHAKETIAALMQHGYELHICTGADRPTALGYAQSLGIPKEHVVYNAVPKKNDQDAHTKSELIERLRKQGKTIAMMGDAGNDNLALAESDFGIAVPSESCDALTLDNADAIITKQSLLPLLHCFNIAKDSMRNIKQNLFFSLSYNTASLLLSSLLLIGAGVALNPAISAGLMVLQTGFILGNVFRFAQAQTHHNDASRHNDAITTQAMRQLGTSIENNLKPLSPSEQASYAPSSQQSCLDAMPEKFENSHGASVGCS